MKPVPAPTPVPTAEVTGKKSQLMTVSVDDVVLLMPGQYVKACQAASDIDTGDPVRYSVGWIRHEHSRLPVYGFNQNFELITKIGERRNLCLILADVDIAILCTDIKPAMLTVDSIHDLPECMTVSGTPVKAVCVCSHDRLIYTRLLISPQSIRRFVDYSVRHF